MAPHIGIEASKVILAVAPGGEADQAELRLWNDGPAAVRVCLSVQGLDPAWCRFSPDELVLLPGGRAAARLVVKAPASAPLGLYTTLVVATGTAVAAGGAPETGAAHATSHMALWVEAPDGLLFPLAPRRGQMLVRLRNGRKAAWAVRLQATSVDRALDIHIEPESIVVPPGGEAVAQLCVRQRRRSLTGPAQAYHFSLAVLPTAAAAPLPLLQLPCEVRIAPPLAFLSRRMPALTPPGRRLARLSHPPVSRWAHAAMRSGSGPRGLALVSVALLAILAAVALAVSRGSDQSPAARMAAPAPTAPRELSAGSMVAPPVIWRFVAEPSTLAAGSATLVQWETAGADRLFLDGQPVGPAGALTLVPDSTREFVLRAENAAGTAVQRLLVLVEAPPVTATMYTDDINAGEEQQAQGEAPETAAEGDPPESGVAALPRGSGTIRRLLPARPSSPALRAAAPPAASWPEAAVPLLPPAEEPPAAALEMQPVTPAPVPALANSGGQGAERPPPPPAAPPAPAAAVIIPAEPRQDAGPPAQSARPAPTAAQPPHTPAGQPQPARPPAAPAAPAATALPTAPAAAPRPPPARASPSPQAPRAPHAGPEPCAKGRQPNERAGCQDDVRPRGNSSQGAGGRGMSVR